jgi:uncharacterized protein GlcG (DUF336 family)
MEEITLEMARKILNASIRWARDVGKGFISVAVVNKGGAIIAVERMDGAAPLTAEVAIEKAWSVVSFKAPGIFLARLIDPRNAGSLMGDHGIGLIGRGKSRLASIPGSIAVTGKNGPMDMIGAVACSGFPSGIGEVSDTSACQAGIVALYD